MNYKFSLTAKKVLKQVIIALISIIAAGLMNQYPSIANFSVLGGWTIYALLVALADYLKHRWGVNI